MTFKKLITLFFILTAIEAVAAIIWLGSMPAEAGNAFALGFSLQRLLMMSGVLGLGLFNLVCAWFCQYKSSLILRAELFFSNRWTGLAAGISCAMAWVLIFAPAYQWGRFAGYKDRLLPLILWLLVVGIQASFIVIRQRKQKWAGSLWSVLAARPGLIKVWMILAVIFSGGIVAVAVFRIGLVPDIIYWNDANVPLLGIQIVGVIAGSLLFMGLLSGTGFFIEREKSRLQQIFPDIAICLLIWGLAVVSWTQVSMPHSYFSPGPYPPNGEMYPFSDAAGYDRSAQFAVIGEGLGTNQYTDKPLYVAFLSMIHIIAGNRMQSVVGMQVAVISLLPVLIYLIGRKVHNRLAGIMAAGFFIFREINNIQGTLWVLSTNSRVLMSESLVTLLLAFFVLMLTGWVQNTRNILYLVAAAGSLGLAALVRLNPLLLMPVTFVIIWLVCWKRWKNGLLNSTVFFVVFLATIFPWMLQSYDRHGNFLYFNSTVNGVVLGQRTYYSLNVTAPVKTPVPDESSVTPTPQPPSQQPVNKTWNRISGISRYVSAHFFHNMINGVALFPTSLVFDSLEKTIKTPYSYWSADWDGDLSPGQMTLAFLSILILALGVAAGWSANGWAGLVPAGFLGVYSLATAAARTSGGRYILPADWVFLLYFAFGIGQVIIWKNEWLHGDVLQPVLRSIQLPENRLKSHWQVGAIIVLFVFVGSSPAILDRTIPQRYKPVDKQTIAAEITRQGKLGSLGISESDLELFLQSPDAVIYRGRGLSPRYYSQNQGEPDRFSPMRVLPFPRLVMEIIGPDGTASGVLPLSKPPDSLPNGSDVLAIGCRNQWNDDWLALLIDNADSHIYLRSPGATWTCPVAEPVCNDNRICR